MTNEEINQRIDQLEVYLNKLTTNKVALSTKYFPRFLGLHIGVIS